MGRRSFGGLLGGAVASSLLPGSARASFNSVAEAMAGFAALQRAGLMFADGKPVDLARLSQRRILIVNFWAYWCPNCIQEFGDLKRMQDHYGANIVGVVLVSEEKNWGRDVAEAHHLGISWPMARYSDSIGLPNKAKMLNGQFANGKLTYGLPFSWVILDDRPATSYVGNPGWANGDAARFIAGMFK